MNEAISSLSVQESGVPFMDVCAYVAGGEEPVHAYWLAATE
jgi:hypothetical protein